MKEREFQSSILYQMEEKGYCAAKAAIFLSLVLVPDTSVPEEINLSEQKKEERRFELFRFELFKVYAPNLMWDVYEKSMNDKSRRGFAIARQAFPQMTEEMCQEVVELRRSEDKTYDYVNKHIDVFKDSLLWEQFSEKFLEKEIQKGWEYHVRWALEYFSDADADNEEYAEDSGAEGTEGLVPVLLWRDSSCDEDKTWHGGTFDERFELANKYLKLPNMDIKEAGDALREADPEQEVAVRCGNAVVVGCQEDGYNYFYIGMANPKRPWIIKHYVHSCWELIGYVEMNKYGYVIDKCLK